MPYGYADSESGAIRYPTLSSILSTAPQPGMRATALDAPGSMLYEVGGKWGGSLGRISFANLSALPVAYIAQGTTADVTADGYSVMSHELRGGRWLPIRPADKRLFDDFPTSICWVTRANAADNSWREVCYVPSRDRLVAVSESGTGNRVMTSDDGGVTWVTRASAADNLWFSVCYVPSRDRLVAVSSDGVGNRVMTSDNGGVTWVTRASAADNNWRAVTYIPSRDRLVAVADSGTGNRVMTSGGFV